MNKVEKYENKFMKSSMQMKNLFCSYIRKNKEIFKSVMSYGIYMTFQIVIIWLLLELCVYDVRKIEYEHFIVGMVIGISVFIIISMLMPMFIKNHIMYAFFQKFFVRKSGYANEKIKAISYVFVAIGIVLFSIYVYRFDILSDIGPNIPITDISLIELSKMPIALIMLTFMYAIALSAMMRSSNNSNRYINQARYNIRHNYNVENEYIKQKEIDEETLKKRDWLYFQAEKALTSVKYAETQMDYIAEVINYITGREEKINVIELSEFKKKLMLLVMGTCVISIKYPDTYVDSISLLSSIDELLIYRGKNCETFSVQYNEEKIDIVNEVNKVCSFISWK